MKSTKRARLRVHGWRVGSAAAFLVLTPEEAAFVTTTLALSRSVRGRRRAQNVSQALQVKRRDTAVAIRRGKSRQPN